MIKQETLHIKVVDCYPSFPTFCVRHNIPDFNLQSDYVMVEREVSTQNITAIFQSDLAGNTGDCIWCIN